MTQNLGGGEIASGAGGSGLVRRGAVEGRSEQGQGPSQRLRGSAVGEPEPPLASQSAPGDREDPQLQESLDEGDVVRDGALHEQVERTGGAGAVVADPGQVVVKQIPHGLLGADVHGVLLQVGHDPLHERRGVYVSERPVVEHNGGV